MPAWWRRKSSNRNREKHAQSLVFIDPDLNISNLKNSMNKSDRSRSEEKSRSLDELVQGNSRLSSGEFGHTSSSTGGASGFSGFDSDGGDRRGHPLPKPSNSGIDHAAGSLSVSSASSSGSSDEHPHLERRDQFGVSRGHEDGMRNMRARSPGPGPRWTPTSMSPLHPKMSGVNSDSPSGRHEDGRNQGYPLPLPPSSPTSPSSVRPVRASCVAENANANTSSKWKKGRLLGRGTFGHVYQGFDCEGGLMCAIKEVRIDSDDQTSRESFKQLNQEINLLSQLKHNNIVRYYGSELGEETLSVYLEYVSGGSIHKLLQEYGPFKEAVIKNYTRQILSGLAYLHSRNTVHRDIKGANILVDPDGEIKLADFGMAKHVNSCTSMLSFKGSPYWMAPEVVMNKNGYGLAVDIWSLGCTIIEMATSKPPWSHQYEGVQAIFKIGNSKDIPEIPDHLSSDGKSFIKLCLQRDPSARPPSERLLDHPFLNDQPMMRSPPSPGVTTEMSSFTFDGIRQLKPLDVNPHRKSTSLYDADLVWGPAMTVSREFMYSQDIATTITSLPVSPCSSPLRRHNAACRNYFLSPPHPSYPGAWKSSYNVTDYSLSPTRASASYPFDPWHEPTEFRSRTPGGSPSRGFI